MYKKKNAQRTEAEKARDFNVMKEPKTTLGKNIRRYRLKLDISQEEVAQRSGLTVQMIGKVETGRSADCRASTLFYIAEALGVTLNDLWYPPKLP